MILETVTLTADALKHGTYGVNQQLAGVPRLAIDTDPIPAVPEVLDWARDDQVTSRRGPDTAALIVAPQGILSAAPMKMTHVSDGQVPLVVLFANRDEETAKGLRYALYTIRAALKCLRVFADNAQMPDRQLNNVALWQLVNDMQTITNLEQTLGDTRIHAALGFTWKVRDTL